MSIVHPVQSSDPSPRGVRLAIRVSSTLVVLATLVAAAATLPTSIALIVAMATIPVAAWLLTGLADSLVPATRGAPEGTTAHERRFASEGRRWWSTANGVGRAIVALFVSALAIAGASVANRSDDSVSRAFEAFATMNESNRRLLDEIGAADAPLESGRSGIARIAIHEEWMRARTALIERTSAFGTATDDDLVFDARQEFVERFDQARIAVDSISGEWQIGDSSLRSTSPEHSGVIAPLGRLLIATQRFESAVDRAVVLRSARAEFGSCVAYVAGFVIVSACGLWACAPRMRRVGSRIGMLGLERRRFSAFLRDIPTAAIMFDLDDRCVHATNAWLEWTGSTEDVVLGTRASDLPACSGMPWLDAIAMVRGTGESTSDVSRVTLVGREHSVVRWTVRPWWRAGGERGGVIVVFVDETERVVALAEQASRNALLATIVSNDSVDSVLARAAEIATIDERDASVFVVVRDDVIRTVEPRVSDDPKVTAMRDAARGVVRELASPIEELIDGGVRGTVGSRDGQWRVVVEPISTAGGGRAAALCLVLPSEDARIDDRSMRTLRERARLLGIVFERRDNAHHRDRMIGELEAVRDEQARTLEELARRHADAMATAIETRELRSALDAARDPILTLAADGRVRYANRAYSELVGVDAERLVGSRAPLLDDALTTFAKADGLAAALATGHAWSARLRRRDAAGRTRWIDVSLQPIDGGADVLAESHPDAARDPEHAGVVSGTAGAAGRAIVVQRDVTEQVIAEERREHRRVEADLRARVTHCLQDSEAPLDERLRSMIAKLAAATGGAALCFVDKVDRAFEASIGFPEDADARTRLRQEALASTERGEVDLDGEAEALCSVRFDGDRVIVPVAHGEQRLGALVLACDPADGRFDRGERAESWRRIADVVGLALAGHHARTLIDSARLRAERASASKTAFLANMSHEIRTPMTAILGFADLLAEDELGEDRRRECVDTIRRNGDHLLTVINDILDLARIEEGRFAVEEIDVDPLAVVEEVTELLRPRAEGRGLTLEFEMGSPLPRTVRTDPTRFRQILLNLVGNAIKFTESGGVRLRASVDGVHSDHPLLRVAVIDTGIGLTSAEQARLFRSFAQADVSTTRRYGGSGLGLRISREFARLLGGDVEVSSEIGVGSTFTASIATGALEHAAWIDPHPGRARPRGTGTHERMAATKPAAPLAGARILVVEDGPDNQRLLEHLLRLLGATCEIVDHGAFALGRLGRDAEGHPIAGKVDDEAFDLVLMDMQMPVLDGYQTTRLLRRGGFERPIVALTAHAMKGERDRCLAAGCTAYLAKPIDRARLVECCRGLLERRTAA